MSEIIYTDQNGDCPDLGVVIAELQDKNKAYIDALATRLASATKAGDCELEKKIQEQIDAANSLGDRIKQLEDADKVVGLTPEQISVLAEAADYFREPDDNGVSLKAILDKLAGLDTSLTNVISDTERNKNDISKLQGTIQTVQTQVTDKADKSALDLGLQGKADKTELSSEVQRLESLIDTSGSGGSGVSEDRVKEIICMNNKSVVQKILVKMTEIDQQAIDAKMAEIDAIFAAACPVDPANTSDEDDGVGFGN